MVWLWIILLFFVYTVIGVFIFIHFIFKDKYAGLALEYAIIIIYGFPWLIIMYILERKENK